MSASRFILIACAAWLAGCAGTPSGTAVRGDSPDDDRIPRLRSATDGELIETLLADYFRSLETPAVAAPAAAALPQRSGLSGEGIRVIAAGPAMGEKNGLWHYVGTRLALAHCGHAAVDAELAALRAKPGRVRGLAKRAEPFLHYLVGEAERRELPVDLVLVPMVESGYNPAAQSPKAAAGLWQLIPATGQRFGVEIAEDYDGRYDIHAATGAALSYFKHLRGRFGGDWLLALAAYNAGEGAVDSAIASNRAAGLSTDFWSLPLPAETRAYVPKVLALSRIIAEPERHGVRIDPVQGRPVLARVEIGSGVRPADVGAAAGVPEEVFKLLNPAMKSLSEAPRRKYRLMLPLKNAEVIAANFKGTEWVSATKIVVQKGETLAAIAKRHGVSATALAAWNGLSISSRLKTGQELLVYPA
ncbi:MAG: transglycosylase SLT domain-containing protein [Methylococcus sp.]|nr:transglycosylase SLT domain-containing protein [Methylococcus sp.]